MAKRAATRRYSYDEAFAGPQNILILTAIRAESVGIAQNMRDKRAYGIAFPMDFGVPGWTIKLREIGIKARGLESIKVPDGCKLIIMAGLAGGLDPSLHIGDVIVATAPRWLDVPTTFARRDIATTSAPIMAPVAKARLFAQTQASAVDMETSIVRKWAINKGIDFMGIRAISDTADDAIEPRVMRLVDTYGRPRIVEIVLYLLGNPLRIRQLIKLGRNSKRAARNLGEAVRQIIERLPSDSD